jgi:hypothetical protein
MERRFLKTLAALISATASATSWAACSPIVVDLGHNGIDLGRAGVGVHFDVDNDGIPELVQWVKPRGDEAFLTLDRNNNGIIDNGGELFGVGTPMALEGSTATNGFVGLAQYDSRSLGGNDDGWISAADQIWPHLSLWLDSNADGVSTPKEMLKPESVGFTAFETIPRSHKYYDDAGNILPLWAWAKGERRFERSLMVDVFFLVLPERVAYCTKGNPKPEAGSLIESVVRKG